MENGCSKSEYVGTRRKEQGEDRAWLGKKEVTRGAGGAGLLPGAGDLAFVASRHLSSISKVTERSAGCKDRILSLWSSSLVSETERETPQ